MSDKTILELPYLYRLTVVPSGKRREEVRIVRGYGLFEIPVATSGEAPVSTRWVQMAGHRRYPPRPTEPGEAERQPSVVVTRSFEGRSFLPLGGEEGAPLEGFAEGGRARVRRLRDKANAWDAHDLPTSPILRKNAYRDEADYRKFPTEEEALREAQGSFGKPARKVGDDRQACLAEADAKWTEALLVVDGTVWGSNDPRREPHYVVGKWAKEGSTLGGEREIRIGVSCAPPADDMNVAFRADRRDDAVAYANLRAKELGLEVADDGDVVDVPDPASLTLDQAVVLAESIATNARCSTSNRATFEPWPQAMEDALTGIAEAREDADRSPEWASRVFRGFSAFVEAAFSHDLADKQYAGEILAKAGPAWTAWEAFESDRRPELTAQDEAESLSF